MRMGSAKFVIGKDLGFTLYFGLPEGLETSPSQSRSSNDRPVHHFHTAKHPCALQPRASPSPIGQRHRWRLRQRRLCACQLAAPPRRKARPKPPPAFAPLPICTARQPELRRGSARRCRSPQAGLWPVIPENFDERALTFIELNQEPASVVSKEKARTAAGFFVEPAIPSRRSGPFSRASIFALGLDQLAPAGDARAGGTARRAGRARPSRRRGRCCVTVLELRRREIEARSSSGPRSAASTPNTLLDAVRRVPSTRSTHPLQHAHVLAVAGPDELAVGTLAEPVDAVDLRQLARPRAPASRPGPASAGSSRSCCSR